MIYSSTHSHQPLLSAEWFETCLTTSQSGWRSSVLLWPDNLVSSQVKRFRYKFNQIILVLYKIYSDHCVESIDKFIFYLIDRAGKVAKKKQLSTDSIFVPKTRDWRRLQSRMFGANLWHKHSVGLGNKQYVTQNSLI